MKNESILNRVIALYNGLLSYPNLRKNYPAGTLSVLHGIVNHPNPLTQITPEVEKMLIDAGVLTGPIPESLKSMGDEAEATPTAPPPPVAGADGWVEPPWYRLLKAALGANGITFRDKRGVLLIGPAGGGKTRAVTRACKELAKPVAVMQVSQGMTRDDFLGELVLVNGSTQRADGPLVRMVREGGVLVLEEVNMVGANMFSLLNTLTDGSGCPLTLLDGTQVPVHPDFRVACTMNEGYHGDRGLNGAMRNRLVSIVVDYLPPDVEREIIRGWGVDIDTANRMIQVAGAVRAARSEHMFDWSPRTMSYIIDLWRHGLVFDWNAAFSLALDELGDRLIHAHQRNQIQAILDSLSVSSWPAPVFA